MQEAYQPYFVLYLGMEEIAMRIDFEKGKGQKLGKSFEIDEEDVSKLEGWNFLYYKNSSNREYVRLTRKIKGVWEHVDLHRFLMGLGIGDRNVQVDHKNKN